MEVRTTTQKNKLFTIDQRKELLDTFLENSKQIGNDSLKVDRELFLEAAAKENVQFEFVSLKSIDLHKNSFEIFNARNAIIEAEYAIAETGQLVVDTENSEQLLTIFMAEVLHVIVPASKILYATDDLELISGKSASEIGRGIISCNASGRTKGLSFAPKVSKTMVYVIEDL